ncbi:MAG TPA: hypothetical protein VI911_05840 [Patescibacteria group bacterium]|nr:hypothetical protein [Patescibacteria group bacterium]
MYHQIVLDLHDRKISIDEYLSEASVLRNKYISSDLVDSYKLVDMKVLRKTRMKKVGVPMLLYLLIGTVSFLVEPSKLDVTAILAIITNNLLFIGGYYWYFFCNPEKQLKIYLNSSLKKANIYNITK